LPIYFILIKLEFYFDQQTDNIPIISAIISEILIFFKILLDFYKLILYYKAANLFKLIPKRQNLRN